MTPYVRFLASRAGYFCVSADWNDEHLTKRERILVVGENPQKVHGIKKMLLNHERRITEISVNSTCDYMPGGENVPHHAAEFKEVPTTLTIPPAVDPLHKDRGRQAIERKPHALSKEAYDRIVTWMRGRIGESITEDMVHALNPMGRQAFRRAFEARAGMPPMHFLTWMRVDLAVRLLIDTRFNLNEIAFVTGLENKQTLADTFLGTIGVGPQALRVSSR